MLKIRSILLFFFIFSFSVLLMGNETADKYFPATIDSFWVYEDQDGNEFTRRAVEGEEIDGKIYQAFSFEPELEDWNDYNPFLQSSLYDINESGISLNVGGDLKKTLETRLESEADILLDIFKAQTDPGATLNVSIKTDAQNDFLLLPETVAVNEEWDSAKTSAEFSMVFTDPDMRDPDGLTFIFDIIESGKAIETETVQVPAGTFEECLKVEYRTETNVNVMPEDAADDMDPAGETITTVWYAPNVGIIKFHQKRKYTFLELIPDTEDFPIPPDPKPITYELKKYEIKTEDTGSDESE